jgi:hypothetical protein
VPRNSEDPPEAKSIIVFHDSDTIASIESPLDVAEKMNLAEEDFE